MSDQPYTTSDAADLVETLATGARLIGLTGRAGAGKNEAAKALVAAGWAEDAFANRMRTAMLALDPWIDVDALGRGTVVRLADIITRCGWDDAKRTYPEIRRLLQQFGTEAGRDIHGVDCWVNALFDCYLDDSGRRAFGDGLVICDVRFNNEAEGVRELGGIVVEIVRPGLAALPGGHASEAGVDPTLIDHTLHNAGSVAALHQAIIKAVARLDEPRAAA